MRNRLDCTGGHHLGKAAAGLLGTVKSSRLGCFLGETETAGCFLMLPALRVGRVRWHGGSALVNSLKTQACIV